MRSAQTTIHLFIMIILQRATIGPNGLWVLVATHTENRFGVRKPRDDRSHTGRQYARSARVHIMCNLYKFVGSMTFDAFRTVIEAELVIFFRKLTLKKGLGQILK